MAKDGQLPPSPQEKENRRLQAVVVFVLLCAVFLFLWLASQTETLASPQDVVLRTKKIIRNDKDEATCLALCNSRRAQRSRHFGLRRTSGGNESSPAGQTIIKDFHNADRKDLVSLVASAKQRLLEKLRVEYGNLYFKQMYQDGNTFRPFYPATPDGDSWNRLKRKISIKVLSAQLAARQQEANVHGLCDCVNGDKPLQLDVNVTAESMVVDTVFGRYVWATGGHSASAGHGNLYNESYTAYMERDLLDVFGAVGLEFEGRNYAMGGTGSAAEISMCWEQIFGSDVDFFSWDYGMTDGNDPSKLFHFGYRGGLSPGRPAVMGIHMNGRSRGGREAALKDLEKLGMAAFFGNEDAMTKLREGVPDSAGMSDADIAALPEMVRNLKCGDAIEKGDPYCGRDKFTDYICQRRAAKTSWHPGYKDHAMIGRGLSLLMVEALLAAVKDLAAHEMLDAEELLQQMQREEDELFGQFMDAEVFDNHLNLFKVPDAIQPNASSKVFFTGQSMCHTGRTPSRTRYLGYLTNTDKLGGPCPFGEETYDVGINVDEALKHPTMDGTMRLAWTQHKEREVCEVTCMPDYKDFFLTSEQDGWTKLSIPNAAEKKAYRYDPSNFQGIVVLILRTCSWGKCENGFLTATDFEEKKWEMKVNGKTVVELGHIGIEALVAKGKDGIHFAPNQDGAFDIQINVREKDSFVKVSSFVIY